MPGLFLPHPLRKRLYQSLREAPLPKVEGKRTPVRSVAVGTGMEVGCFLPLLLREEGQGEGKAGQAS